MSELIDIRLSIMITINGQDVVKLTSPTTEDKMVIKDLKKIHDLLVKTHTHRKKLCFSYVVEPDDIPMNPGDVAIVIYEDK